MVDFLSPSFLLIGSVVFTLLMRPLECLYMSLVGGCVKRASWWPKTKVLLRALLIGFGVPEEMIEDEKLHEMVLLGIFVGFHHSSAGALGLPVLALGWEESGVLGQQLFVMGGMVNIGWEVSHLVVMTLLLICPAKVACLGPPCDCLGWVLTFVHHSLSIVLFVPCLLFYPDARPFHIIFVSLLLPAGIALIWSAYRITLDATELVSLRKIQAGAVIQVVLYVWTRGFVWFPAMYSFLTIFADDNDNEHAPKFFWAGCILGVGMSIFNIKCIYDVTCDCVKWVMKPKPESTEDQVEIAIGILRSDVSDRALHGIATPKASKSGLMQGTLSASSKRSLRESFMKQRESSRSELIKSSLAEQS